MGWRGKWVNRIRTSISQLLAGAPEQGEKVRSRVRRKDEAGFTESLKMRWGTMMSVQTGTRDHRGKCPLQLPG